VIVMPYEDPLSGFLTVQKAANRLGLSVAHLRREIRLGKLPSHRFGRMVRISEADLAAYIQTRRREVR
jgi:excisionase family DNA binding protein